MDFLKIVKNLNTLKAMKRAGLITFCDQTGEKIHGLYSSNLFTCYYINEAPYKFTYKDHEYGQKYFSGCFYPYIVQFN